MNVAEFDQRLTRVVECRRRATETADKAVAAAAVYRAALDEELQREAESRHHVDVLTQHIDALLAHRHPA